MTNKTITLALERAAFEALVQEKSERFQPDFRRLGEHPEAEYKCANNQWAWELWQARAALAEPVPPDGGVVEFPAYRDLESHPVADIEYQRDVGYNQALAETRPIVTRLQAEVEQWRASNKANALAAGEMVEGLKAELTKARELLRSIYVMTYPTLTGEFRARVEACLSNQSAPADKEECTSCDGSGEFIDAIGDWRGYCSCPAGVELKNRPAPSDKCISCDGTGVDLDGAVNPDGGPSDCLECGGRGSLPNKLASADKGQGEPVAWRYHDEAGSSTWFNGAPEQVNLEFVERRRGRIERSFAGEPAQVAVVMPEHRDSDLRSPVYGYARGWNACLDEFARLNPEPKP